MKQAAGSKLVNGAIGAVLLLIGLTALTGGWLIYTLFFSPKPAQHITPTVTVVPHTAQPTDTPTKPEFTIPTPIPQRNLNTPFSGIEPTPPVTPTAKPSADLPPSVTATLAVVEPLIAAHPTYQPTTQPCGECHQNLRSAGK